MKISRSLFSKLRLEYDILKMKSAYILAEKEIMQNPGLTAWEDHSHVKTNEGKYYFASEPIGPETFFKTRDRSFKDVEIMAMEAELTAMEEQGRKLLKEEKYELMRELKEVYEKVKQQLNRLKNG